MAIKMPSLVRYNGQVESYHFCSDPKNLVKGKIYRVIGCEVDTWQTNYILEGVEGTYNSVWFDTFVESKPVLTNMTICKNMPQVGYRAILHRIIYNDGTLSLQSLTTSTVKEVTLLDKNLYKINTRNSVYIVQRIG